MHQTPQRLTSEERAGVTWRISSRSPDGGANCVEAGSLCDESGRVAVRHSHHPGGHTLVYSRTGWTALTHTIRAGAYDF